MNHNLIAALATALSITSATFAGDCQPHWDTDVGQPGLFSGALALAAFDGAGGNLGGPALYAGGAFTSAGGQPANHIAKWNGSSWSPLGTGITDSSYVEAIALFDDNPNGESPNPSLYAGGLFSTAGGKPASSIAKWDGTSWSALGSGVGGPLPAIFALAVFDDGFGDGPALYAGGFFTMAGSTPANRIAKWNGESWSALGSGTSGVILSLVGVDDHSGSGPALYAGGGFDIAGGVTANRIAKWNGESWSGLGSGMNAALISLEVFDDGSGAHPALFAAGEFTTAGGTLVNHIAKWDGESWSAMDGGIIDLTFALAVFDDGHGDALYVGGGIVSAGGQQADGIVAWRGCAKQTPCAPADLNCDNAINTADLLILLAEWGRCNDINNCPADLDGDNTVGVSDLLILLSNWTG